MLSREETLLMTLKGKFASQFAKRFGDMKPEAISMVISGTLVGVSDEQFQIGLNRLLAPGNKFMPDLAEFQTWCVSGSWWSATEAWQRACDCSNNPKLKVTTLTKKAWDSVCWLVTQGDMKAAQREFKSIYDEYLAKAQAQGRQQEWYVPPVMIEGPKAAAVPKFKVSDEGRQIAELTTQLMSEGLKWGEAFKQAQIQVRGEENPIFRGVV